MKIIKKILGGIVDFLMLVVIVIAIGVTLVSLTSDNNGVSKVGTYIPLNVKTESMEPTINEGDFIIVEECDPYELKVGDVISFLSSEQDEYIVKTHRIVAIEGADSSKSFITRGDNNPFDDDVPVYPVDVIGKWNDVKLSKVGYILDFVSSRYGFLFLIILPLFILFVYQIYRFIIVIIEEKNTAIIEKSKELEKKIETEETVQKNE